MRSGQNNWLDRKSNKPQLCNDASATTGDREMLRAADLFEWVLDGERVTENRKNRHETARSYAAGSSNRFVVIHDIHALTARNA